MKPENKQLSPDKIFEQFAIALLCDEVHYQKGDIKKATEVMDRFMNSPEGRAIKHQFEQFVGNAFRAGQILQQQIDKAKAGVPSH